MYEREWILDHRLLYNIRVIEENANDRFSDFTKHIQSAEITNR